MVRQRDQSQHITALCIASRGKKMTQTTRPSVCAKQLCGFKIENYHQRYIRASWWSLYQWRHLGNTGAALGRRPIDNETISRVDSFVRSLQSNVLHAVRLTRPIGRTSHCLGPIHVDRCKRPIAAPLDSPHVRSTVSGVTPRRRLRVIRPASPVAALLCLIIRPGRPQNY